MEAEGETGRGPSGNMAYGTGAEPRAQCTAGSDRASGMTGGQCVRPWGAMSAWTAHVLLIVTEVPHKLAEPCQRDFLGSENVGWGLGSPDE